jgi:hypothetical protein
VGLLVKYSVLQFQIRILICATACGTVKYEYSELYSYFTGRRFTITARDDLVEGSSSGRADRAVVLALGLPALLLLAGPERCTLHSSTNNEGGSTSSGAFCYSSLFFPSLISVSQPDGCSSCGWYMITRYISE